MISLGVFMKKSKSLLVRMSPELHKQLKLIAVRNDRSINGYVINAIEKIVKSEEKKNKYEK